MFKFIEILKSGAAWTGILLIAVPIFVMSQGLEQLSQDPVTGLPILAVLGICVLFGACALVAVVFAQLGLTDTSQALALPEGSIRATIALALIVLFAIIAIMLYQTSIRGNVYETGSVTSAFKDKVVSENQGRIALVLPATCPPARAASAGVAEDCFTVRVRAPDSPAAADIAKQLLILVGTLMTAVTSFYYAQRGANAPATPQVTLPKISSVSPNPVELVTGQGFDLKLAGSNLELVTAVFLEKPGTSLQAQKVLSNQDMVECTFSNDLKIAAGAWTLVVADANGRKSNWKDPVSLTPAK